MDLKQNQLNALINVFGQINEQAKQEEKKEKDEIENLVNDFDLSIANTQEVDGNNDRGISEDDAEIYNDTIHKLENGTDTSRNDLINAIQSFRKFKLPEFKNLQVQRVRAPVIFHGTYISKVAMDKLNKQHKWDIAWKAGFLVASNAEFVAIKFKESKNKDKYHLNQIEKFLKALWKKSGVKRKYHFGQWQVLNGYACKPIYPDIEDIIPSGHFSFIGK